MAERRFPWGLTVVCALAFALLVSLGVWQVQRLRWKEGLIARAEAAAARPPAPLSDALADADPEFRQVVLACPGLATAAWVELQSINEGRPGVRLISACRPAEADRAFLIDRGFVADEISARPQVSVSTLPLAVVGRLRRTPPALIGAPAPDDGRFFDRDNVAMARVLGIQGPVSELTVYATTSTNPQWPALQPSAPPAAFSNNHLGYALTWFGLALALAGFYIALLRRRPGAAPREPS